MNFFDYRGIQMFQDNIKNFSYDSLNQRINLVLRDETKTYINYASKNLYNVFKKWMISQSDIMNLI